MLHFPDATTYRHSRVALVFRTVIIDKAGEMDWRRLVVAEVVDSDIAGVAILLTTARTHLQFPVWALHEPTETIAEALTQFESASRALENFRVDRVSYVGGQELIWDIHNAVTPSSLRCVTREEVAQFLADHDLVRDAEA